jgi:uncharacterized protein with NAD-binding domain and iron-sulfur cluster
MRNRRGYSMGVPTVPLGELYSSRLLSEKCTLCLAALVSGLEIAAGRVEGLRMQDGDLKTADYYVSALPADALTNLLSEEQRRQWPATKDWAALEWSPITGIHLWFDRRVMQVEHLTVCGRTIQWIFDKSTLRARGAGAGNDRNEDGQYIQLVISASRSLVMMKREDILELAMRELGEILPPTRQAVLQKAVVVKETKATASFPPGADNRRPGTDTPFVNLLLAGDWTATEWPPTMEGAVRSGYRAAERVTEAAGKPQRFLVPDLTTDLLARLLVRF